jgi:hypothetical protein
VNYTGFYRDLLSLPLWYLPPVFTGAIPIWLVFKKHSRWGKWDRLIFIIPIALIVAIYWLANLGSVPNQFLWNDRMRLGGDIRIEAFWLGCLLPIGLLGRTAFTKYSSRAAQING